MKFSELMQRVSKRGVKVVEMRAGEDPDVLGVCEDSRKVKAGDVFVARVGVKADGAKYVADAISRGAVGVVRESSHGKSPDEIETQRTQSPQRSFGNVSVSSVVLSVAVVEDVNLACAILAHEVAGNPTSGMKMIGITGTKGKTTVAYLMRSVLKAAGLKVGMIGTVEIDDGKEVVPAEMTTPGSVELVSLFEKMRANGVTHCVMEVSSHALHQRRVAGIDWAVAIFTNLTGDHLDYHGTMEEYAAAKAILFEGLKEGAVAVVNMDDPWVEKIVVGCKAKVVPYKLFPTPEERPATSPKPPGPPDRGWGGLIIDMTSRMMRLHVRGKRGLAPHFQSVANINTSLVGRHNALNLLAVVTTVSELGVWPDDVYNEVFFNALQEAKGAPGRLQRVSVDGQDFEVFVDYAHTHGALENVLTALRATMGLGENSQDEARGTGGERQLARAVENGGLRGRLICLFGCGGDRDRTKRPKMGAVAERLADVVIVTSDNPRTEDPGAIIEEICAGFSEGWKTADKITVEADRRAAIKKAIGMAQKGDVVLLAGKGHENYQIIGTTKYHFDDVEEAQAALKERGL